MKTKSTGTHDGRYVALLRGVNNAGPSTRVAMSDLRAMFGRLGYRDVKTLLNSGNVVFTMSGSDAGEASRRIEAALEAKLKKSVRVIVLPAKDVAAIVRENPLARVAKLTSALLVLVPRDRADLRRLKALAAQRWAPEVLEVGRRAAYLWCAQGVANSALWIAVDRALEGTGTARNIATFTKLDGAAASIAPA